MMRGLAELGAPEDYINTRINDLGYYHRRKLHKDDLKGYEKLHELSAHASKLRDDKLALSEDNKLSCLTAHANPSGPSENNEK